MATRILHRRGTGIPSADQFASTGEILIDTSTGTAYNLNDSGDVVALGGGSEGGSGAGMVISPDEPADPITGMQWLESTTGRVWIYDDGKWLEFPANVPAGDEIDTSQFAQSKYFNQRNSGRAIHIGNSFVGSLRNYRGIAIGEKIMGQSEGSCIIATEGPAEIKAGAAGVYSFGNSQYTDDSTGYSFVFGHHSKTDAPNQFAVGWDEVSGITFEDTLNEVKFQKSVKKFIMASPDSTAEFKGTVQAKDFLDADGNSIQNKQQVLTQSEYDAITPDPDTLYFIV